MNTRLPCSHDKYMANSIHGRGFGGCMETDERRSVPESWLRSVHGRWAILVDWTLATWPIDLTNRFALVTEGTSTMTALASS